MVSGHIKLDWLGRSSNMSTTPEGKVKKIVRGILERYGVYYYMPVPTGFGSRTVDFIGCSKGRFFAIETKREGKEPTLAQSITLGRMVASGGKTFVVAGLQSPVLRE